MATKALTQQQIDRQVIELLAELGGRRTKDDEIRFEGTSFVFPLQYRGDLQGLQRFIDRYVDAQSETTIVKETFEYRPMDGAHATYQMLKKYFGYAQSKAKQGMFGPEPPAEVNIPVGYVNGELQHMTIPWGRMVLPLLNAMMDMGTTRSRDGDLFTLSTSCRKVDKETIEGFYKEVRDYLHDHSIYRGHAVNGGMDYFDTDRIDPAQFVYTEKVWIDAGVHIFSPMKDTAVLDAKNLDPKRVVLLEGPFGTGKSGLGRTAAKVAVANGWTAIFCRPGVDDPFDVLRTARLYLPTENQRGGCLVFIEDIDVLAKDKRDTQYTSRLLDAFDGFETKGQPFVLVLTTNHAEEITQGMTRPGRIHGIIRIGAMDRPGVEKLANVVIGKELAPDVDFDAVYEATADYMPAFVREALERALRYTIARTGKVEVITTEDLVHACESLRDQFNLHMAAQDRPDKLPALDVMFRDIIHAEAAIDTDKLAEVVDGQIEHRINGAYLVSEATGEAKFQIQTN